MSSEDGLKLVLEKQRFIDMLKKLTVGGMFPTVDITVKDGKLFSNHMCTGNNAYRIAVFKESYFKHIDKLGFFNCDAEVLLHDSKSWMGGLSNSELLTINRTEDKINISSGKTNFTFDIDCLRGCEHKKPFSFEGGIPIFNNGVKLDTHFEVKLNDVKKHLKHLKKECYLTFIIKNKELSIILWNLSKNSQIVLEPKNKILNGDELVVTFDHNITNMFQVFSSDMIHVHTKTGQPAWFSEETDDYALGIMFANNDDVDESPIF